jgi:hypothetical protein
MIPNRYWLIGLRWSVLIIGCAVTFGALAYWAVNEGPLQPSSSYDSSFSLGVSRVLSLDGEVTQGSAPAPEGDAVNRFATAMVEWSTTPQFASRVSALLETQGVIMPAADVSRNVSISLAPRASRTTNEVNLRPITPNAITISGRSRDQAEATQIVSAAAGVIRTKAAEDELAIRTTLLQDYEASQADLLERLQATYASINTALGRAAAATATRTTGSVLEQARISNNPNLVLLSGRAEAIERELTTVGATLERLHAMTTQANQPLVITSEADTVSATPLTVIQGRDFAVLGALAGLAFGWVLANIAERLRLSLRQSRQQRRSSSPLVREEAT